MAITQDEMQSIVNAVLSALHTNSRTIDQLTPVITLSDNDSFEINGGKRVKYALLREMVVESARKLLSRELVDTINDSEKHVNEALANVASALPKAINLSELDTLGTDGSGDALWALSSSLSNTQFRVMEGGVVVGNMQLMSDNMGHVLTEILTTHYNLINADGSLDFSAHKCTRVYQFFRSFNLAGPSSVGPLNAWTPWAPMEPESLTECNKKIESFPQPLTIGNRLSVNGILDLGHFSSLGAACDYAARSDISGSRDAIILRFTYQGAAGKVSSFILQSVKGDNVSMQVLLDKCTIKRRNVTGATGIAGQDTNAFMWEEASPQKLEYDQASRTLRMKSYETNTVATAIIPLATASFPGLMSSEEKSKLANLPENDLLAETLSQLYDKESVFCFDYVASHKTWGYQPTPDEIGMHEKPGSIVGYIDDRGAIKALLVGLNEQWIELPVKADDVSDIWPSSQSLDRRLMSVLDDSGENIISLRSDAFFRISISANDPDSSVYDGLYSLTCSPKKSDASCAILSKVATTSDIESISQRIEVASGDEVRNLLRNSLKS